LETRSKGQGLSYEYVVVMIASLERLAFLESVELLQHAYHLNGLSVTDEVNAAGVHEVLRSWLLLFRQGANANLENIDLHLDFKIRMERVPSWHHLIEYEHDALMNFDFANKDKHNPFESRWYTFQVTSNVVQELAHGYGKWQNGDCLAMKEHMMTLDHAGSGRVPLDLFYAQPDESTYHFHESLDYLRSIGALDENSGKTPQVRIANYVVGPTNCIARSAYYSVCCFNECENVMSEIEGKIMAPMASPEQLLRIVGNLSISRISETSPEITQAVKAKLTMIADRHNGAVPIHGRLFAQWLHFAFPYECPYPQQVSAEVLVPRQYSDGRAAASADEKKMHMEAGLKSEPSVSEPSMSSWSDDEVLPLFDHPVHSSERHGVCGWILGTLAKLAPVVVLLRTAYSALNSAVRAHRGEIGENKAGLLV